MKYSVVLFDLDGTLINTNELILTSFLYTLEKHCPGKYTKEDIIARMGQPLVEQMRFFDERQAEEMVKTYQVHNESHHDELVKEFPYVREVLADLHQAGIKMGVVTNKRRKMAEMGLKRFGLDQWMQVVVCVEDTKQAKPAPDMIHLALEKLAAPKESALMVGDSRFDLLAAERAGIDSAAVGWSLHLEELEAYHPTYVLHDMRDLLNMMGISKVKQGAKFE
ncbi:pyrophosphatase PpaX [Thermoflavimicrobium dichotomicum]|uniref:Pyrophosphatase PpaX n=1 Tax=Thermoflavimicrobium dichotomicum TaxID=46223 RepID=A0A1I3JTU9_9BACL|nr:pyrophosphatase PpaX [Thermoflavimicrobium dichotomicum]SFI63699.1 pyrophosphatase PpaX [Thermoflavimicrobium dichotomicum]